MKKQMKIIFVDYSKKYYLNVAKTAVPDKRFGKFIQIRHDTTEYLIFSPKELTLYHADIVRLFCTEREIGGNYNNSSKCFDIYEPAWIVVGGGKFEIDSTKKYVRLYDDSLAYGRFNTKGLREKIHSIDGFSNFEVQIE